MCPLRLPAPTPLQKWRPSALAIEPLPAKESPSPERTPGHGAELLAAAAAGLSPNQATAQLLSSAVEAGMAHTLPQGARTKLEHRGSVHRATLLAGHSSNPSLDPAPPSSRPGSGTPPLPSMITPR